MLRQPQKRVKERKNGVRADYRTGHGGRSAATDATTTFHQVTGHLMSFTDLKQRGGLVRALGNRLRTPRVEGAPAGRGRLRRRFPASAGAWAAPGRTVGVAARSALVYGCRGAR